MYFVKVVSLYNTTENLSRFIGKVSHYYLPIKKRPFLLLFLNRRNGKNGLFIGIIYRLIPILELVTSTFSQFSAINISLASSSLMVT